MKFEEAIALLRAGKAVRRESWRQDNCLYVEREYKCLVFESDILGSRMIEYELGLDDIFAEDWIMAWPEVER